MKVFKPNKQQAEILKFIEANPDKKLMMRHGEPSYEMIQLAKYLKGDTGKLKIGKIFIDEYTES